MAGAPTGIGTGKPSNGRVPQSQGPDSVARTDRMNSRLRFVRRAFVTGSDGGRSSSLPWRRMLTSVLVASGIRGVVSLSRTVRYERVRDGHFARQCGFDRR